MGTKMKKAFIKQVLTGIAGMVISASIFALVIGFLNTRILDNKWLLYAAMAIIVSVFFGFMLYIFGGKESFIFGAKLGFGFVAFIVSMKEMPQPFSGILIVILVVIFLVWPRLKEYFIENKKPSKKAQEKLKEEIELELRETEADKEFKDSIQYSDKSLLLFAPMGGIYQVINGKDTFYFVRVGGELTGIDKELLKKDFSDEREFLKNKKDFSIDKKDITSISFNQKHSANCPFPQSGKICISTNSARKNFVILDSVDSQKIEKFFVIGANSVVKRPNPSYSIPPEKSLSRNDRLILPRLKRICLVLDVLAIVAPAVFLFVDLNYRLMSTICLLIPIVILVLYFKYNNILSFEDEKAGKTYGRSKIRMELPLIFPSLGLGLRSLLDFNFTEYRMFLFWSVIIFSAALLSFFLFTTEYKTKKSAILVMVISMLFYAPSATAQVNYLLDSSKPIISYSQVINKHIDTSSKGPDRYILTVNLKNGKQCDLMVSRTYYNMVEKGRTVQISEKTGFLKIEYASVNEE
jgi:hypothetical protein